MSRSQLEADGKKPIKQQIKQQHQPEHTSARIGVCLSGPAAAVIDELQDVPDGRELWRVGGGGGLPGQESQGGHLAVRQITRHGFLSLLQSLLVDLSGETGDDVGGRAGCCSHENLLTAGTWLVSGDMLIVSFTHAGKFLSQTP